MSKSGSPKSKDKQKANQAPTGGGGGSPSPAKSQSTRSSGGGSQSKSPVKELTEDEELDAWIGKSTLLYTTPLPAWKGKVGEEIRVLTNHYRLNINAVTTIYSYKVSAEIEGSADDSDKDGKGKQKSATSSNQPKTSGKPTGAENDPPGPNVDPFTPGDSSSSRLTRPGFRNASRRQMRRLLWLLLDRDGAFKRAATDYSAKIVSLDPLSEKQEAKSWQVVLEEETENQIHFDAEKLRQRRWTMTLTLVKEISTNQFKQYIQSPNHAPISASYRAEILDAVNLFLSRKPSQDRNYDVQVVRKNKFFDTRSERDRQPLGDDLEAYFGFDRSVRTAPGELFLQLNVSASAFFEVKGLGDIASMMSPAGPARADLLALTAKIRGLRVRTTYSARGDNHGERRDYTIWGFAKPHNPRLPPTPNNVQFSWDRNAQGGLVASLMVTVQQYFREALGIITNNNALVINVGATRREVAIPCNLLWIRPGNYYRRLLERAQTGTMVSFASLRPAANMNQLEQFGKPLFGIANIDGGQNIPVSQALAYSVTVANPDPLLKKETFGMPVTPQMVAFTARRLPLPTLNYLTETQGGNQSDTVDERRFTTKFQAQPKPMSRSRFKPPHHGNWNLNLRNFATVPKAPRWTWVEFYETDGSMCYQDQQNAFLDGVEACLIKYCSTGTSRAQFVDHEGANQPVRFSVPDLEGQLTRLLTSIKARGIDVVFIILQSQNAANYEMIKLIADVKVGIHTICTTQKTGPRGPNGVLKSTPDFFGNLALKCNAKMGGVNTSLLDVGDGSVQSVLSPTTMIVGADVTHPSPGSMKGCPSIAAVVASTDRYFANYPASIKCQTSKREMIDNLDTMLLERLELWRKKNKGALPTQILFFRDGVSEGEYGKLLSIELPLIRKAIAMIYDREKVKKPNLLLICIVKRISTRFFPAHNERNVDNTKGNNFFPGLVIDHTVTYERGYDWYMQSQMGLQGTAKPAHYVVIVDEIGAPADVLQKAIFWQCFTFSRSTKPISIHPAARCADRACNRARAYLRKFLVAGDHADETYGSGPLGNAADAWLAGVHPNLAESAFYL